MNIYGHAIRSFLNYHFWNFKSLTDVIHWIFRFLGGSRSIVRPPIMWINWALIRLHRYFHSRSLRVSRVLKGNFHSRFLRVSWFRTVLRILFSTIFVPVLRVLPSTIFVLVLRVLLSTIFVLVLRILFSTIFVSVLRILLSTIFVPVLRILLCTVLVMRILLSTIFVTRILLFIASKILICLVPISPFVKIQWIVSESRRWILLVLSCLN